MRRTLLAVLFLSALTAAYVGGRPPAPKDLPEPRSGVKVGIINLLLVYENYQGYKEIKREMENLLEPYKTKKQELRKLAGEWKAILKEGKLAEKNLERGQKIVTDCQRQLEDLDYEINTKVARRLETLMVQVVKEVSEHVHRHADANGFHLILAYGKSEKAAPEFLTRQIGAFDRGLLAVGYTAAGVDVTADVLRELNENYRAAQPINKNADEEEPK